MGALSSHAAGLVFQRSPYARFLRWLMCCSMGPGLSQDILLDSTFYLQSVSMEFLFEALTFE